MGNMDLFEESKIKFNEYLEKYLSNLNALLDKIEHELSINDMLSNIRNIENPKEILKHKDMLLELDSNLAESFKVLEIFDNEGILKGPQVQGAINKIKNCKALSNVNNSEIVIRRAEIENNISKIESILCGEIEDYDYYVSLVEESDLSETEKINIFAYYALDSIVPVKKIEDVEEKNISDTEEIQNDTKEEIDVSDSINRFNDLVKKAQSFQNDFYYLIKKRGKNEIKYIFETVNAVSSDKSNLFYEIARNYSDSESVIVGCLYKIGLLIEEINEIDITNGQKDDKELYDVYLDELSETINVALEKGEELKEIEQLSNGGKHTVLFLLDETGQPLFDMSEFKNYDRDSAARCIEKLEQGIKDYNKGDKCTIVNGIKERVYVNKQDQMAVSFVTLDKDSVLVLTVDRKDKDRIYNSTINIEKRYRTEIQNWKKVFPTLSQEEKTKLFEEQEELRKQLLVQNSEKEVLL